MFKKCTSLVTALTLSLLMAGAAMAEEVLIINATGFEIHSIALSASESNSWGDDLLGDGVLNPGDGLKINLSGDTDGWDMAVVDPEGQQLEFHGLNFTGYSQLTLYSDGTGRFE